MVLASHCMQHIIRYQLLKKCMSSNTRSLLPSSSCLLNIFFLTLMTVYGWCLNHIDKTLHHITATLHLFTFAPVYILLVLCCCLPRLCIIIRYIAYSKCPGLWSLKNIWLNLQFSLFMSVFKTFFILNAFHCEFLAFCFQLPKAQLFLLRLFVGFKFKFCCEVGSWKLNIANGLLHVLMV